MKRTVIILFALACLATSCNRQPAGAKQSEPLILSAAASTKDVIEALAAEFKTETGIEVKVNPGSSSSLANQILSGAPADLFLSANQEWADAVDKGGEASSKVRLLTNKFVIAVPVANPGNIKQPSDLLSDRVKKVALAGEKVPAGTYAEQALTKLGLYEPLNTSGKVVRGQDVRITLSYVERGEVEAGIVYSTDVAAAKGVSIVHEFDPALHDKIVYVLVLLKQAEQNPAARKLYDFLQSTQADSTYKKHGFTRFALTSDLSPLTSRH